MDSRRPVGRLLSRFMRPILSVSAASARGPERSRLAREIETSRRVVFAGERDDVPRMLSAMDLFVSPSEEETFELAVVEAAASCLHVITADCPARDAVSLNGVSRIPPTCPRFAKPCSRKGFWAHTPAMSRDSPSATIYGRSLPRWMTSSRP